MSEYQYYEFVAIDRPLSKAEMIHLRERSSRAKITPSSFVNEYNWGDLKGDPADWMRRYFDAFVYTANWCSCQLALRFPLETFTRTEIAPYVADAALTMDASKTHWIINWSLNEGQDYDRFAMEGGEGWMGRLMPLRDELLCGDLRPLYLGWLAGVTAGEVGEDDLEPEVPPGMAQLTAAQQALVEFLEIDPDLLAAAVSGSPPAWEADDSAECWIAGLSRSEIFSMISLMLNGTAQQAQRKVQSEFATWLKESGSIESSTAELRTVAELFEHAKAAESVRVAEEAKELARQEAKHHKQRETYLSSLAQDFAKHWKMADQHAERGVASGYDDAKRMIADLADAYQFKSDKATFDQAMRRFMTRHTKRGAFVRRLVEAGLWQK
ncbi:hypothetical protein EO087_15205 [Dyella sp. M7H15-1]|uniref:hypothetical protein n=1 Tax=Dyella sp. M7H15-1 TaxID=2501295 RepID=UPI001004DFF4|nr:hypothetical protein [Dyella sp. M7H15-1]QAU25169.1 hypothetical protein EO087_15205 [Dyella sp. M7H15-1]